MNEEIILKMVEPYVKDGSITYDEFDLIFSDLSKREQYSVADVLAEHGIELRVSEKDYDDLFQADEDLIKKLEDGELPDEASAEEEDFDLDLSFQLQDAKRHTEKPHSEEDDDADLYYSSEYKKISDKDNPDQHSR